MYGLFYSLYKMIQKRKISTYVHVGAKITTIKIPFGAEIRKCCVLNQSKRDGFKVGLKKRNNL